MNTPPDAWSEVCGLVMQLAAGQITAAELSRLEWMLRDNVEAQGWYHELRALNVELSWRFGRGLPVRPPGLHRVAWVARRSVGLVAAMTVMMLALLGIPRPEIADRPPPIYAEMSEVVGEVEVLAQGQSATPEGPTRPLHSGQTIRTGDVASSAAVVYPDGLRLDLASGTVVRLGPSQPAEQVSKEVFLSSGVLRAEMPPSSDETPMIISTPHAAIHLHGATLSSSVGPTSTRVELVAGRADLIRHADGLPTHLTRGTQVVSTSDTLPVIIHATPPLATDPIATWRNCGSALAYAPDSTSLAVAWGDRVRLQDTQNGQERSILTGGPGDIHQAAITLPGRHLIACGRGPDALIWDLIDHQGPHRLPVGPSGTRCLALSPDGHRVALVANQKERQGRVVLWDLESHEVMGCLEDIRSDIISIAISADGQVLAAGTHDHRVNLWDLRAGEIRHALDLGKGRARALAFTPDSRYLITAGEDHTVRWWDTSNWNLVQSHDCCPAEVGSLAISPNGDRAAWGLDDGTVEVWQSTLGQPWSPVAIFGGFRKRGPEALAFSPDGRTLATTRAWEPVKLWALPVSR